MEEGIHGSSVRPIGPEADLQQQMEATSMRSKKFAILGLSTALVMSLVLVTRLARADVILNADIPISFFDVDQCTGEFIFFSGPVHVVLRETLDDSGGLHFGIHQDYTDVT